MNDPDQKRRLIQKLLCTESTRCYTCGAKTVRIDGGKVLAEREKRGLTGKDLATRAGFSEGHLNAIENGKRTGTKYVTIEALYDALKAYDAEQEASPC